MLSNEEKIDKVLEQQSRMLFILENDDKTGRVGLVQTVQVIRTDLDKLIHNTKVKDAVKKRENVIFGGIGATAILLIKWIGTILFNVLAK